MEFLGEYDCVILGEHPAGLWSALHLASLDKKVLVLPLDSLPGMSSLPRKVALDFGWTPEECDRGGDLLQILTPERRFRIPPSREDLEREYEFQFGELPGHAASISNEIVRGLAHYSRGSETGPVIGQEWEAWTKLCLGTVYFEREPGYVIRRMLRQLSGRGVHISRVGALKQIFLDRGTLVGVQLSGSSKMIAARAGLLSAHVDHLKSFMTERVSIESDPQGWRFSMRLSCNPAALPVGTGSRMLYVQKDAPILEIHQTRPGDFSLSTQLPLGEESFDRGFQRRLCERMMKVCQEIFPDIEYNLQILVPELRDPERTEKVELPAIFPFHSVEEVPFDRLVYGASRGLGHVTPVGNLYLVGPEANPRQGIWGAFEAAILSLEAMARKNQTVTGKPPTPPSIHG